VSRPPWWKRGCGETLVLACVAAVGGWSWTRVAAQPEGGIAVFPEELALGAVPEGEERLVRFVVSNDRSVPADVEVMPSCTCMALGQGRLRLDPHASVEVPIRVATARKPGFNVAHLQVAGASGAALAQGRITFTAVRSFVIDPPVLFLQEGGARPVARVACLAADVPGALRAETGDPALEAAVVRTGRRTWNVAISSTGTPRSRLAPVRLVALGAEGEEPAGELMVSLPSTRVGDVRVSPAAEALDAGRARAWMVVDAESGCDLAVRSLKAVSGPAPEWRAVPGAGPGGSHVWVELLYLRGAPPSLIEVAIAARDVEERLRIELPAVAP
jgi:hypothetical protein